MLKYFTSRELNYSHFIDAVQATSDYGESKYYKNRLSIVGTYYENPIENKILSEPRIEIIDLEDDLGSVGAIGITLNADEREQEGLELLNLLLGRAGIGVLDKEQNSYINDYYLALGDVGGELKDYLSKNTILDQVSDYNITFLVTEPKVEQRRFKINGVNYYQYTLISRGHIAEVEYEHKIHVLFKDRQYDGETFLTQFIGEDITRGDGIKILDTLANENISGLAIGTVRYETKRDPNFNSFFVAYTSPTRLEYAEGTYALSTIESRLVFNKEAIRGIHVGTNEKGTYYTITIETSENIIDIYLT